MQVPTVKVAVIVAAVTEASVATSAGAQDRLDTDGDGVLVYNELIAGYPEMTEATFLTIDADASGSIDGAELDAAVRSGTLPPS